MKSLALSSLLAALALLQIFASCKESVSGMCGEDGTDMSQMMQAVPEQLMGTYLGHFEDVASQEEMFCPITGLELEFVVAASDPLCIGDEDVHGPGAVVDCADSAIEGTWELSGSVSVAGEAPFSLPGEAVVVPCHGGPAYTLRLGGGGGLDISYAVDTGDVAITEGEWTWVEVSSSEDADIFCLVVIDHFDQL